MGCACTVPALIGSACDCVELHVLLTSATFDVDDVNNIMAEALATTKDCGAFTAP